MRKLHAYNLNALYPTAGTDAKHDTHGKSETNPDQKYIDTVLLVMQYVRSGDLFDILYYTSALKEVVARTSFKQLIDGLEACHNANVVHRNLKLSSFLLDSKYNLRITDFALSKRIMLETEATMTGVDVSRGFQAPEMLISSVLEWTCSFCRLDVKFLYSIRTISSL